MPDMASGCPDTELSDVISDAMSGVRKVTNFIPAINYPSSITQPSYTILKICVKSSANILDMEEDLVSKCGMLPFESGFDA